MRGVRVDSLARGWARFRAWPWWGQALMWALLWPVPLAMRAATRSGGARRTWVVLSSAVSLVWVGLVLTAASTGESPEPGTAALAADGSTSTTARPPAADTTTAPAASDPSQTASGEGGAFDAAIASNIDGSYGPGAGEPANAPGRDLLDELTITPEGSRSGYHPELFVHWSDLDRDGCNTRDEVFLGEEVGGRAQIDPDGCRVVRGIWQSVYDGVTTHDPAAFDIDHVVDLAEAWESGASAWSPAKREAFANDLGYEHALVAVSKSSHAAKGDKDPAEWQPAGDAARCWLANAWTTTKVRWVLTADRAEVDALRGMFDACDRLATSAPPLPGPR